MSEGTAAAWETGDTRLELTTNFRGSFQNIQTRFFYFICGFKIVKPLSVCDHLCRQAVQYQMLGSLCSNFKRLLIVLVDSVIIYS